VIAYSVGKLAWRVRHPIALGEQGSDLALGFIVRNFAGLPSRIDRGGRLAYLSLEHANYDLQSLSPAACGSRGHQSRREVLVIG